jgi:protoporphyrinogen/coproporphyrinogen III oxidase
MKRIAVVGAGITGLTAAHELTRAGHAVTVFESRGEAGGAIRTIQRDGWLVEAGPNTLLLRDRSLDGFFSEAGLDRELQVANPEAEKRFIVRGGRPHALPQGPLGAVFTPIFNFPGKLRVLWEPFVPQNRTNPDETLDSFARRRVGQEFLDYAVNPFVGGVYACAPEDLCVRHALPRLWRLEQNHGSLVKGSIALMQAKRKSGERTKARLVSFRGGMQTLPATLARRLGDAFRPNTEVVGLERGAVAWRIHTRAAGLAGVEEFEQVLLCTAAPALARLEIDGATPLASLATMPYSAVVSVALGFDRSAVPHPLDGFGMLVPAKEGRRILGSLFSSTLFPGRAPDGRVLLTTFVGGRQPELAALPEAEIEQIVRAELAELLGVRAAPVFRQLSRWPQAIPKYTVEFGRFVATMEAFERDHAGLFLAGHFRNGISLSDCLAAGRAVAARVG